MRRGGYTLGSTCSCAIAVIVSMAAIAAVVVSAFQHPSSPRSFATTRPAYHHQQWSDLPNQKRHHHPKRSQQMTMTLNLVVTPDHIDSAQSLWQHWETVAKTMAASASSSSSLDLSLLAPSAAADLSAVKHELSGFLVAASDAATAAAAATKDLSWWDQYLLIFKNTLNFVHSTIDGPLRSAGWDQTWGVSIFLFTASARALILPLSIQQSKSAEYMKALRPYITQIQEKFKNNENAKNQAVGRLYQDAEQNPLAGCLTSLFQLPIFLGLYRGIRLLALDGELEEPFLWIPSLQGPVTAETDYRGLDWLLQGWTANPDPSGFPYVPSLGWETTIAFLVMPVVLVCLQTATMRVLAPPNPTDDASMDESTKETMDRTQNILKFLPLMIGFFSLQVPAGLTIYWFTSNIFTLSSSLAVRAYFKANPPKIELPDYWDTLSADKDFADMTPDERRQAMEAGIRVGPTMEELIEESKFHFYVDRRNTKLLLASSAGADISSNNIPREMQDWVASGPPPLRRSHQQEPLGREPSSSVEVTANAAAAVVMEEAAAAAAKSSA